MAEDNIVWLFAAAAWEDSDYIVSVRPSFEPEWRAVPIGSVLDRKDALVVAQWLSDGGFAALLKIAENIAKAKSEGEWPPTNFE